jgi:hypothetical protein
MQQQSINGVNLVSTPAGTRLPASAQNTPLQFALVGDVVLNGALTQPESTLTISVRVARYNASVSEAVTPVITLRAQAREWAQLPARTTLAVLDALSVSLNEEERVALLREASPLMPAATPMRLAAERRLGEAITTAIEAQWLQGQSQLAVTVPAKRALLGRSVQQGTLALQRLRNAAALPASTQPGERPVFAEVQREARSWLPAAQTTVRTSQASLQLLNASLAQSASRSQSAKPRKLPSRRAQ